MTIQRLFILGLLFLVVSVDCVAGNRSSAQRPVETAVRNKKLLKPRVSAVIASRRLQNKILKKTGMERLYSAALKENESKSEFDKIKLQFSFKFLGVDDSKLLTNGSNQSPSESLNNTRYLIEYRDPSIGVLNAKRDGGFDFNFFGTHPLEGGRDVATALREILEEHLRFGRRFGLNLINPLKLLPIIRANPRDQYDIWFLNWVESAVDEEDKIERVNSEKYRFEKELTEIYREDFFGLSEDDVVQLRTAFRPAKRFIFNWNLQRDGSIEIDSEGLIYKLPLKSKIFRDAIFEATDLASANPSQDPRFNNAERRYAHESTSSDRCHLNAEAYEKLYQNVNKVNDSLVSQAMKRVLDLNSSLEDATNSYFDVVFKSTSLRPEDYLKVLTAYVERALTHIELKDFGQKEMDGGAKQYKRISLMIHPDKTMGMSDEVLHQLEKLGKHLNNLKDRARSNQPDKPL